MGPLAEACQCVSWTPEEFFDNSELVFVGVATEPAADTLWVIPWTPFSVTTFESVEILKDYWLWKPGAPTRISVSNGDPYVCGASFTPGTRYLVSAYRPEFNSVEYQLAQTGYCSYKAVTDTSDVLRRIRTVAASWDWAGPSLDSLYADDDTEASAPTKSFLGWSLTLNAALLLSFIVTWLVRRAQAS